MKNKPISKGLLKPTNYNKISNQKGCGRLFNEGNELFDKTCGYKGKLCEDCKPKNTRNPGKKGCRKKYCGLNELCEDCKTETSGNLSDKIDEVFDDLIEYWKDKNKEVFEDLKALKETLGDLHKESIKELMELTKEDLKKGAYGGIDDCEYGCWDIFLEKIEKIFGRFK